MTRGTSLAAIAMIVAFLLPALAAAPSAAVDFRVENRVFLDDEEEPRAQSTTLFYHGVVYDYLEDPAEVTVFDPSRGRFILLDLKRRVRTEVPAERVEKLVERVGQWAGEHSDPFLRFLAKPELDTDFDPDSGVLTLASKWLTYRAETEAAPSEAASRQYREFCDAYSKLNTLLNPGGRPPFARLELDAALARHGRFPREIHLQMRPKQGFMAKRIEISSRHQLIGRLVESDRDRIAQTDQYLAIFQPVPFGEYQRQIEP